MRMYENRDIRKRESTTEGNKWNQKGTNVGKPSSLKSVKRSRRQKEKAKKNPPQWPCRRKKKENKLK